MKIYNKKGDAITLNDSNFIFQGGQGSVYGKDGIAYKIYNNESDAISEKKIKELGKIDIENVIKPEFPLFNSKKTCIGYAMKQIDSKISLCQLFNSSFKIRNNISNYNICKIVEDMQEKIEHIHEKGILIVDFNEMNFLVDQNNYSKVFFIDVDSYKTPSFEAGAIAEHIRDRHSKTFTKESDWFSFAVTAFRLFIGLHPYKGRHDIYKDLNTRMIANVSAFNKEVKVPAMCPSFSVIPNELKNWLELVLEKGQRISPPKSIGNHIFVPSFNVEIVSGLGNFIVTTIKEVKHNIAKHFETSKEQIVTTALNTYVGNLELKYAYPYVHEELDRTYLINNPYGTHFHIYDYQLKTEIQNNIKFEQIFNINNQLCYKESGGIYRIKVNKVGNNSIVTSHLICNVLQNATQIFENVLIQNMLGNYFVSIFDKNWGHNSIKINELKEYSITDAKYEDQVLIVKGVQKTTSKGLVNNKYDKFVIIFDKKFSKYSIRKLEDIGMEDVNFSVIESKGIVCHLREGLIELFSKDINHNEIKEISETNTGNLIFTKSNEYLTALNNNKLVKISMKQ